jgi:hypothetical protein
LLTTVMLLLAPMMLLTTMMLTLPTMLLRRPIPTVNIAARQINIDPPLILLRPIRQPQLLTNLLDARLDLLHMPDTVIPLPNNNMQVPLPGLARIADPLLQDILGLLDELAVQIDGVGVDAARSVVLAEDEFGGLFVVGGHLCAVRFAFVAQGLCGGAVAGVVGFFGARETFAALVGFGACEVAQAVVFGFRFVGLRVVEGWVGG